MANPTVKSLAEDLSSLKSDLGSVVSAVKDLAGAVKASQEAPKAQPKAKAKEAPKAARLAEPTETELFRVGSMSVSLEVSRFTYRNQTTDFAGLVIRDIRVTRGRNCRPIRVNFLTNSPDHWEAMTSPEFVAKLTEAFDKCRKGISRDSELEVIAAGMGISVEDAR